LFCSSQPTASSGCGLTDPFTSERQHTLEFFPRQPKKDRHLFKLRAPRVICRRGAKTFDAGRKFNAAHLLWRRVAGSATTIRILMDTKFTKLHCNISLHSTLAIFKSVQRRKTTSTIQGFQSNRQAPLAFAQCLQPCECVGRYLSVAARPSSILIPANRTARGVAFLFLPPIAAKVCACRASHRRLFFIHYQPAAIDFFYIKLRDGRCAFFARSHLDKAETARISRNSSGYSGGLDRPGLCEQMLMLARLIRRAMICLCAIARARGWRRRPERRR